MSLRDLDMAGSRVWAKWEPRRVNGKHPRIEGLKSKTREGGRCGALKNRSQGEISSRTLGWMLESSCWCGGRKFRFFPSTPFLFPVKPHFLWEVFPDLWTRWGVLHRLLRAALSSPSPSSWLSSSLISSMVLSKYLSSFYLSSLNLCTVAKNNTFSQGCKGEIKECVGSVSTEARFWCDVRTATG